MRHLPSIHRQPSAASALPYRLTSVRAPKRLHVAPTGPVAPLSGDARHEVLAHLLRLSDHDLRMRFMRCMPVATIEAHVASIDFDAALRLGIRRQGRLVAMVEGLVFGASGDTTMEVAFSTDPAWRRRGLARALGHAIADIAARRGVGRIVASCDARNGPMTSLLRAFEAKIEREDGELSASWMPTRHAQVADFGFEHFVCPIEEQTARRLFATLPLAAAYAPRLVQALATGMLVATIESACIAEVQRHLADGETVVGVEVHVRHLGPALPGRGLRICGRGRWKANTRHRAFDVTVDDGQGRVATARVVLAVVGAARFAAGLVRKHEAAGAAATHR